MANQIQATVVNINGTPIPTAQTRSFLTSSIVVTAETTSTSPTALSKIYYFDAPFQQQVFYVTEEVAALVAAANTDGTSQVALTCYKINGYPQKQSLDISIPASGFVTQSVSDSPIVTVVNFMKLTFGVSETEDDIVTAANAGGDGAVSSVFGRTGAVVAASSDYTFSQIGSTPTTLSGYGITDASSINAVYNDQTGTTYSLQNSDNGKVVTLSNGSAITLTVPASLSAGFNCSIVQLGAGQVTITPSSTTIHNRQSFTKTAGQYAMVTILMYTTNTFITQGDMA